MEILDEVVDLEEYARAGKRPPKARSYRYRVDTDRRETNKEQLTGRKILESVGREPAEDYILIQRMRGAPNEVINLDEVVDFTTPGIERFVSAKLGDEDLIITVFSPRSPEPKQFTWDKAKLVGDAAREAAAAFGYSGGNPGLTKDDVVLDNAKTLEAAGVEHGDELELVDTGGGV